MTTKLVTAITAGSLLLSSIAAPLTFADTQISGNGAFSTSNATVTNTNTQTVNQNNTATVNNNVTSNENTGNNTADFNTGGSTFIGTGGASSSVTLDTRANVNQASLGNNTNADNVGSVSITGNGYASDNRANVTNTNANRVNQRNTANVNNNVTNNANTGNNHANGNTGGINGGGTTSIFTGPADSTTDIGTAVNANIASIGNNGFSAGVGTVDIDGNGAFSRNIASLFNNNSAVVYQTNNANIRNNVRSNNTTGDNTADFNTNGSTEISTGGASDQTTIRNLANFNAASLDFDNAALFGTNVRLLGNGYGSDNTFTGFNTNTASVNENNRGNLSNNVRPESQTGNNSATGNTGGFGGGNVGVFTNGGSSDTAVSNNTGINMFGQGITLPNGLNLNFTWDWNSLFGNLWTM